MPNLCVFCGSRDGLSPEIHHETKALGALLAKSGWGLVYGGGKVGLMGALADAVMADGGTVIGVIPRFMLEKEVAHRGLTELILVDSMHERKKKMDDPRPLKQQDLQKLQA